MRWAKREPPPPPRLELLRAKLWLRRPAPKPLGFAEPPKREGPPEERAGPLKPPERAGPPEEELPPGRGAGPV